MPIVANNKYYVIKANGKYYDIVNQFAMYTLTIVPTPSDATVTLTATGYSQVGNSITVRRGTTVSWSVSKTDYITQSGSQQVNSDESLDIELQEEVYPAGTVIFESSTPGTYNITLEHTQNYEICMVGGGGGARSGALINSGGGSGAFISGIIDISNGIYPTNIGAGGAGGANGQNGGNTTFMSQIAGGGGGSVSMDGGNRGTYNITLSGFIGVNGNKGGSHAEGSSGGASVYGGYGKGGAGTSSSAESGGNGYFKIVAR